MTISWFSRVKYVDICWRTLELGWTRVNYGKTYHDISLINGNFHTLPLEPNGSMAPIELSDALGSSHPNVASAKCLDQIIRKWPGWVGYDGWHGTATKPWRHEKLNNLIINNSNTVIQCNTSLPKQPVDSSSICSIQQSFAPNHLGFSGSFTTGQVSLEPHLLQECHPSAPPQANLQWSKLGHDPNWSGFWMVPCVLSVDHMDCKETLMMSSFVLKLYLIFCRRDPLTWVSQFDPGIS